MPKSLVLRMLIGFDGPLWLVTALLRYLLLLKGVLFSELAAAGLAHRHYRGDGLLSETGAMAWFMGLPVAQRREMASVAFFMADSLLDSLDARGLTMSDLETRDALEGVEALLRACGTDTAALRATLDNYDQAAKDVPVEGTSTLLEQVWLAYPDDWWGRKPADVVEVAGVAELA